MSYPPSKKVYLQSDNRATAWRGVPAYQGVQHRYSHGAMTSTQPRQPRYSIDIPMKQYPRPGMSLFHQVSHQPLRDFSNNVAPSFHDHNGYNANRTERYSAPIASTFDHHPKTCNRFSSGYFEHPTMQASSLYNVPDHRIPDHRIPDHRISDHRIPDRRIPDHGLRLLSACTDFPEVAAVSSMNANIVAKSSDMLTTSSDDIEIAGQLLHSIAQRTDAVQFSNPKRSAKPIKTPKVSSVKVQTNHPLMSGCAIDVREVADHHISKKVRVDEVAKACDVRMSFGEDITKRLNLLVQVPITQKPCKCSRSQCLKLYCECFYRGKLCNLHLCKCQECLNTEEHNGPGGPRATAVSSVLARRTDAFERQTKKKTGEGCSCKKTRCLKKYCDCYSNNKICSSYCKCFDCSNTVADFDVPKPKQIERASEQVKQNVQENED